MKQGGTAAATAGSGKEVRVWFNKSFSSILGVIQQLRDGWAGPLRLYGSHTDAGAGPLRACDVREVEPRGLGAEAYAAWCLEFCARHEIDVFIPGRMREDLADRRALFEAAGVRLVVAGSGETLRLLEDKGTFLESLPPGVRTHAFHRVRTGAEFLAAVQAVAATGARVCFKPSRGTFGQGFYVLDDRLSPLERLLSGETHRISLAEAGAVFAQAGRFPEVLVMEYLEGPEHSVDVLAQAGRVVAMMCRRKPFHGVLRGAPEPRSGLGPGLAEAGTHQVMERAPEVEEMVRVLVGHFRLEGLLNVQFRSPAVWPLEPRLLEINGRMSGGLPYVALSGLNLPVLAVKLALWPEVDPLAGAPAPRLPLKVRENTEVVVVP